MLIIGAGLSGLIAAHVFRNPEIIEIAPEPREQHQALLRFRTDAVSRLTNIPFRKVTVRKGIWSEGQFREPNIQLANWYSQKVIGRIANRSVWDLEPVARYIAPPKFYWMLVDKLSDKIHWGTDWQPTTDDLPVISTIPMPVNLQRCGIDYQVEFVKQSITVHRYSIRNADIHQTIYFPCQDTVVYRASMTGETLIIETVSDAPLRHKAFSEVLEAFGIDQAAVTAISYQEQKYGKIAVIDDAARRHYIRQLTQDHKVYSLGRFAVWRNILLDDLVNDIDVISKLIEADSYSSAIIASKGK